MLPALARFQECSRNPKTDLVTPRVALKLLARLYRHVRKLTADTINTQERSLQAVNQLLEVSNA